MLVSVGSVADSAVVETASEVISVEISVVRVSFFLSFPGISFTIISTITKRSRNIRNGFNNPDKSEPFFLLRRPASVLR